MAFQAPREVVASAARTASGDSGTLRVETPASQLNVAVDVTAVSGTTPTLDIEVEWSTDAGTTFFAADPADSLTQITAATKVVKQVAPKAPHYRLVWTIAGASASFTFAVDEYLT